MNSLISTKGFLLCCAVAVINGAFLWALIAIPTLKDFLVLPIIGVLSTLTVSFVADLFRGTADSDKTLWLKVTCWHALLFSCVCLWAATTSFRAPAITRALFEVADNAAPGTFVGTVVRKDGNPGAMKYEILEEQGRDRPFYFRIHSSTGDLTLAEPFERDASELGIFQLLVRVTDAFGHAGQEYIFVKILDENQPPELSRIDRFTFHSHCVKGDVIGTIAAFDPEGDRLTYRIKSGNELGILQIHESVGSLKIVNMRNRPVESRVLELEIEVSDGIAPPVTGWVRVQYLEL